jgi:uncharacterized protein (DUF2147 family)
MKRIIQKKSLFLVAIIFSFLFTSTAWAASPLGTWTTLDDKTHKPRGVIQITEVKDTLYGKIIKIFPQPGDFAVCANCPGSFKNKKIKGLVVMWGLKKSGRNNWSGGQILDPKTGRIYSCKLTVGTKGRTLKVRGYVGLALIGRTQTWIRLSNSKKESASTENKTSSESKTQAVNVRSFGITAQPQKNTSSNDKLVQPINKTSTLNSKLPAK